jgi:hypothetical protein
VNALRVLLSVVLFAALLGGATRAADLDAPVRFLAIDGGYLFSTGGDAYPIAPSVRATAIAPGTPLRLTRNASGIVTAIEPLAASPAATARPLVAAVTFEVLVPPSTLPTDQVYLSTNESGWNALAIRMDRVDALHFRAVVGVPVGGTFRYVYTRGNSPTIERGANGLTRSPRALAVDDASARTVHDAVQHWGDDAGNTRLPAPQVTPTPFNPAPFPNLPNAPPAAGRWPL